MCRIASVAAIIVLVCMLAPPVAAIGDSILPSMLVGADVAQQKALFTANIDDKMTIADIAYEQGDFERAALVYGLAEEQWVKDHRAGTVQRDWLYYDYMATMERKKAEAYRKMGGHEEQVATAEENIKIAQTRSSQEAAKERNNAGSCLIVTATYGSPLSSEVQLVRDYRDVTIKHSYSGSQFVMGFNAWYYTFSPAVASYISTHPLVKSGMQVGLVPLLEIILLSQNLHAMLGFSPELATVSVLLFGAAFYSLVYIFPPAFLTVWLAGRKGWKIPAPGAMRPVLILWILVFCGLAAGIVLSLDLLTIVSSGLLVASTIVLIAGTGSLALMWYLKDRSCIRLS